eukprot:XP_001703912.1 Hypothetical protein GL50803_115723 [Giardia lamblia ATCC 50803]
MASALSPLLLVPEDTHLPPSMLNPSLHSPHTSSITQLLQSPTEHVTPHSTITITVQHSLPKSRLPPAEEPPAEEAHEAPHDSDHSDGDPRDGARGEAALVRAVSSSISAGAIVSLLLRYVTGDRAIATSWRGTAYAVFYTSYCIRASLITIRAFEAFITGTFVIPC